MLWLVGFGSAAVLAVLALAAVATVQRGHGEAAPAGAAAAAEAAPNEGEADIDLRKRLIQSLLLDLSANVTALLGNTQMYATGLERRRKALETTTTLEGVKEIQRDLLAELDEIKKITAAYRDQLAEARQTIEQQQAELEEAREEAGMDGLTRIPNRRSLDARLREEAARAKRYRFAMSVALIDIDNFKEFNDVHGHLVGDRVIQGFAKVLNDSRRQADFLARYGGEEFCILLPQTELAAAALMMERTREQVEASRFRHEEQALKVTCSIGLAQFDPRLDSIETLLARADKGLYQAKSQGRNRCISMAGLEAAAE